MSVAVTVAVTVAAVVACVAVAAALVTAGWVLRGAVAAGRVTWLEGTLVRTQTRTTEARTAVLRAELAAERRRGDLLETTRVVLCEFDAKRLPVDVDQVAIEVAARCDASLAEVFDILSSVSMLPR